ncbi:MAG: hypothetical protein HC900_04885 [Methylacidiphilales bacterium]|nr:hypothetical protein [Candidatus Methylacidiphilales bacterium]
MVGIFQKAFIVRFAAEPRDTTQASDHAQKNGADEGEGHSRSQDVQLVGDVHLVTSRCSDKEKLTATAGPPKRIHRCSAARTTTKIPPL